MGPYGTHKSHLRTTVPNLVLIGKKLRLLACIHTYIHTYTHTYTHTYIHTYIYIHINIENLVSLILFIVSRT